MRPITLPFALLLAVGLAGCVIDTTRAGLTKAEARERLDSEPADSSWDPCADERWYGDDVCDDWCPSPDPDCEAPPGERPCGGLAGLTCTAHEYCDYPDGALCGAADQTGVCRPRPDTWIEIYAPVCGCDGHTYSNEGEAYGNGTDVAHAGACDEPPPPPPPPPPGDRLCGGFAGFACEANEWCDYPDGSMCGAGDQTGICRPRPDTWIEIYAPVCGCDGRTYSNEGEANGNGTDVAHAGTCEEPTDPPVRSCGGIAGLACGAGEFCDYAEGDLCGAADALGTCRVRPDACPELYAPVCGCDGRTYGNACEATAAGVSVATRGECGAPPPPPPPPSDRVCGGFAGFACAANEWCDYGVGDLCGGADALGTCRPRPDACPELYAPVCGCDGRVYDNACFAHGAGVDDAYAGTCPESL